MQADEFVGLEGVGVVLRQVTASVPSLLCFAETSERSTALAFGLYVDPGPVFAASGTVAESGVVAGGNLIEAHGQESVCRGDPSGGQVCDGADSKAKNGGGIGSANRDCTHITSAREAIVPISGGVDVPGLKARSGGCSGNGNEKVKKRKGDPLQMNHRSSFSRLRQGFHAIIIPGSGPNDGISNSLVLKI